MGFPLLLSKALVGVKKRWRRQQYSHLPLLAKGRRVFHILYFVGSRNMDIGFLQVALF